MKAELLYQAGEHGHRVRLVRRGRTLSLQFWDASLPNGERNGRPRRGNWRWIALGHNDVDRGQAQCLEAAAIRCGGSTPAPERQGGIMLVEMFAEFQTAKHQPRLGPQGKTLSPSKSPRQIRSDRHRMYLWQEFLGATREVLTIDSDLVDTYVAWRQEEGISDTTIGHELVFLRGVCNWATRRRGQGGVPLLPFSPIADVRRIWSEEPNTPEMTPERFQRIYRQADRVDRQGFLRPLLMLVNEHGWRLSAWCKFWASDIDLRPWSPSAGVVWPHGRIRKRRANDKGKRKDKWVPMTERSRRAAVRLLRRAAVIGDTPVFRSPKVDGPWQPQHALDLLHRAELAVGHRERLEFLHSQADAVGDRVRVRIGRANYPLAEYLRRHGDKVAAGLRFAARLVRDVNEAMGWEWSASLEPEPGFAFHSMRRAWGSDRKEEPLVDVAEAGDWHPGTLLSHYQKPDPATTLRVVLGGKRRGAGR